ncbi:MAG: hypothetical protein IJC70_04345, partial [Firmicutes bacterium]|nr:hypothetical protein [Bacillota bacterium]
AFAALGFGRSFFLIFVVFAISGSHILPLYFQQPQVREAVILSIVKISRFGDNSVPYIVLHCRR